MNTPSPRFVGTLYRKLVENMNEGVWMGDKDERTVYANPKFCELVGYSLKEILGKVSYTFWEPESAKLVRQINERHRKQGISSSYEGNLLTRQGKIIPVRLSGTPLPDGGTIGIMTDLREMKEKHESAAILDHAIAQSNEAMILIGHDWTIQSWNRGAAHTFGYQRNKIIQKPLDTLFPSLETDELLRSNRGSRVELDAKHAGGGRIKIAATLSVLPKNAKGLKYLMIARDVTAQVRFEEELSLKYDKLSDAYNQFGIIRRQMDYMFELAELSAESTDTKSLADYIVSSIIMLSRVDACTLRIYDEQKGTMRLLSAYGAPEKMLDQNEIPLKGSLAEKSFRQKRPIKVIDIAHEPLYRSVQWARQHNFTSCLVIALSFQSRFVGSLNLYVTPEKKLELFENAFVERYARVIGILLAKWRRTE